jgi:hypothetical protein
VTNSDQPAQTFALIDTSVLLHYRSFPDVDGATLVSTPSVTTVFAPVTVGEPDKHQWSGLRAEKPRAKAVLRALDRLALAYKPIELRQRVHTMAIAHEPQASIHFSLRSRPNEQQRPTAGVVPRVRHSPQ